MSDSRDWLFDPSPKSKETAPAVGDDAAAKEQEQQHQQRNQTEQQQQQLLAPSIEVGQVAIHRNLLAKRQLSARNWISGFDSVFRVLWLLNALLFAAFVTFASLSNGVAWLYVCDPVYVTIMLLMGEAGRRGLCGRGCSLVWAGFFLSFIILYAIASAVLAGLPRAPHHRSNLPDLNTKVQLMVIIVISLRSLFALILLVLFPLYIILLVKLRPSRLTTATRFQRI